MTKTLPKPCSADNPLVEIKSTSDAIVWIVAIWGFVIGVLCIAAMHLQGVI